MICRSLRAAFLTTFLLLAVSCGFANVGASPPPAGALAVNFIDVAQGDATLIQSGGENYLIDAGRPEAGPECPVST